MKKTTLFLAFLLYISSTVCAQDSLRLNILNYNDTVAILSKNGRRLVKDKVARNETKDISAIITLLTTETNKTLTKCRTFSDQELILLNYWTSDFKVILADSLFLDTPPRYYRYNYDCMDTNWRFERFDFSLIAKINEIENKQRIENSLNNADISSEEREFLYIYLRKLKVDYALNAPESEWDGLIAQTKFFLTTYPQSRFQNYLRQQILFERVDTPQRKYTGTGIDMGGGYGQNTGVLANNFKQNGTFNLGIEFQHGKMLYYFRLMGGNADMLTDSVVLNGIRWDKKDAMYLRNLDLGAGYVFAQNQWNRSAITLSAGVLGMNPVKNQKKPEYEDIKHDNLGLTGGLETNFLFRPKSYKQRTPVSHYYNNYHYDGSYGLCLQLKLRYTYTQNFFQDNFNGGIHGITLNIGMWQD
jgi:hypothetical protein